MLGCPMQHIEEPVQLWFVRLLTSIHQRPHSLHSAFQFSRHASMSCIRSRLILPLFSLFTGGICLLYPLKHRG